MRCKFLAVAGGAALLAIAPAVAYCASDASIPAASNPQALNKVVPGQTTKAGVKALFGDPWRAVQFNDCGAAMDDQADETWEYRGSDVNGAFRLHIEFSDNGTVHLIAKIPDNSPGGKGTVARFAPSAPAAGMSM
jgi:hypothetical protein